MLVVLPDEDSYIVYRFLCLDTATAYATSRYRDSRVLEMFLAFVSSLLPPIPVSKQAKFIKKKNPHKYLIRLSFTSLRVAVNLRI